eukprot:4178177-Alexandrium_andersonii.AAC.1
MVRLRGLVVCAGPAPGLSAAEGQGLSLPDGGGFLQAAKALGWADKELRPISDKRTPLRRSDAPSLI